jgi:hypothetical protein
MTTMLSAHELGHMQCQQHAHDLRNHFDILARHKNDRLKHYGLHYGKYVGRLSRGPAESKPVERTVVDTLLVALSAANTLHQNLQKANLDVSDLNADWLRTFADAAGRFADACEKIDHMEEFLPIARTANLDVLAWVLRMASLRGLDLPGAIAERRKELSERTFYIRE